MYKRVGGVFKLLRNINARVVLCHLQRCLQAGFYAFADVAVVMDQNDLCAVVFDQLSALVAYRVWHNDDCLVAAHRADQRKANALVAAGGLYNNGVFMDKSIFFALQDHVISGSGFD